MLASSKRILAVALVLLSGVILVNVFPTRAFAKEEPPATDEDSWFAMYLGGQRIGYQHSVIETVQQNGESVVKTSTMLQMTIKRFNQSMVMRNALLTEETTDGRLRHFRFEMANPPAAASVTSGKIEGTELALTNEVDGRTKTKSIPWQADVKSPAFQDRLLKTNPLKPGETRTFDAFIPEFAKVAQVTLKGVGFEETKLLDKQTKRLFKVSSWHSLAPEIVTDSFLDDKGDSLKMSLAMVGLTIEMYLVPRDEALKAVAGSELDLAIQTLVKVNPLLKSHNSKKVVYRMTIARKDPSDVVPSGDTQTVKKIDKETAEVTVVALPVPASAKIGQVDKEYLESSQFMQSDDERVKNHVKNAVGESTDPSDIAVRMEKYVYQKLKKKNFSTAMASAGEVARTLEGDCTEHAVLLAAMLRAKGIPSRVAVGLVYVESLFAFGGHMWTEAYLNDKWVPLDATRGARGTSAAYLKLSDASLSDDGPAVLSVFAPLTPVMGKIKLDIVSAE